MLVHDGHANARKFFTRGNANSYDSVVSLATFGRDINWKRLILQAIIQKDNVYVLELACGTGILSLVLAKNGMNVTGLDLTYEYLAKARRRIDLALAQGTAEILPYRN
ncbi:MAG TPA: methyltransferase domain-containing protein, partial [Nitrososphaera sp.]|nr:methyltransferase domain-containing protein [Nitrososphaera sp.]